MFKMNIMKIKYCYTCLVGLAIHPRRDKNLLFFASAGLQISVLYIHKSVIYITIKCFNLTKLTETHKNFHYCITLYCYIYILCLHVLHEFKCNKLVYSIVFVSTFLSRVSMSSTLIT